MKSILTGSRVYGEPRSDSDLDMVVLVEDVNDRIELIKMRSPVNAKKKTLKRVRDMGYNGVSLRYDNLNIIMVDDPKIFEAWEKGTQFLKSIAPVTHDQACTVFETMFKIAHEKGVNTVPF